MCKTSRILLLGLVLWSAAVSLARAETEYLSADHVRISWLAPERFGEEATRIGLFFELDPHWHVYWKNPGDSGAAPKFKIDSQGADVGAIQWPYPTRLPIAHLTNLGYEGSTAYLFDVTPTDTRVRLEVELEWLVCKEDCIPGFGTLVLERPAGAGASIWNAHDHERLAKIETRIPASDDAASWRVVSARMTPEGLRLGVLSGVAAERPPEIYPIDGEFVGPSAPDARKTSEGWEFVFKTLPVQTLPASTGFVLVDEGRAWEFPSVSLAPLSIEGPAAAAPLWLLLVLAFAGGVLLNLMPCVFPVLSIKVVSLLQNEEGEASIAARSREGFLYSAGVLATFACLGGAFLMLRAAGTSVGWGFQLQSPVVVLGLALLFWLLALGFLGVISFGDRLAGFAGSAGGTSSFATGVLSVFVATPCTGPFMGTALGASAALPGVQAMAIFLGLGAGLAAPFLGLALSPSLLKRLPKPGPWMETLKQFLAFPLLATVVWLLWVLGKQVDEGGWVVGSVLLLVVSFAVWLGRERSRAWELAALVLALGASALSFVRVNALNGSVENPQNGWWESYEESRVAQARMRGRATFVDFTAAWCITCQVNKQNVLETQAVRELFDRNDVYAVRADWTRRDAAVTDALARFGRNSVPLYVFYPAGGAPPEVLPQLLSTSTIEALFESEN